MSKLNNNLVLLCDQNIFGMSKMVLVWPNWFGLAHNYFVLTKMNLSCPIVTSWNISFPKNPDQHTPMLLGVLTKDEFFITHIFSHINHVSSKKFFPFYVRTWAVMTGMVVHHNNDGLKICQSLQIIFFHCQTPLCHAKLILMDLAFYLIFDFKNMGKFVCLESTKSTKNNWLC